MEKFDFTSAKKTSETTKAKDGISSLISTVIGNLGDKNSQGNASAIYNIIKMLV